MIPDIINSEHLLAAIRRIDKEGYNEKNKSNDYDVYFQGKLYPPKVVVSYAHSFAVSDGTDWSVGKFSSGDETFRFLTKRGFPIVYKDHKNPDNCITVEDCLFFDAISGQPYDPANFLHVNQGNYLNRYIWAKTQIWADRICEKKTSFTREGTTRWHKQLNSSVAKQQFKHYSWYRLHDKNHYNDKVFYTVGFEGPHSGYSRPTELLIKLDCKRNGMAESDEKRFDMLLAREGIMWHYISIPKDEDKIEWEALVEKSLVFIDQSFTVYLKAIELFETIEMAARITWNIHDWTRPSGRIGKSESTATSHENDYGYAPEEWLLDMDKLIDGYHYARMEPFNTKSGKHIGRIYNITLFTHNYDVRRWYWVGKITGAEAIDEKKSEEITAIYQQKGWLDEQIAQLRTLKNVDFHNYERWPASNRFNIRFKDSQLNIYGLEPFSDEEIPPSKHYNLPSLKAFPAFLLERQEASLNLAGLQNGNEQEGSGKRSIIRNYTDKMKELENLHLLVRNGLAQYLRYTSPASRVYTESHKRINRTSIDIHEIRPNGECVFYEVKTYPNVMVSIRVAVGQLLEYAFFPNQRLADKLVIVSHLKANPRELEYLRHLSTVTGVSFSFICFDHDHKLIIPCE